MYVLDRIAKSRRLSCVDMSVLFLAVLGTDDGINLQVHQNVPAGPGHCPPVASPSASSFAAFLEAKHCEWASMRLNARAPRRKFPKLRSLQDASGVLLPAQNHASAQHMNSPPSPPLASAPAPGAFGHFHPPLPSPYPENDTGLPYCRGDRETWNADYGGCDTYGDPSYNQPFCNIDRDWTQDGLIAWQACIECGVCVYWPPPSSLPSSLPSRRRSRRCSPRATAPPRAANVHARFRRRCGRPRR